jgi:outer membrane protein with beta-barrel domain
MNWKTFFLICGLIAFFIFKTNAQEFKLGVQIGIGLSDKRTVFKNSPFGPFDDNSMKKVSYNVNGYLGFKSKYFFGISLEPGFIQKGYHAPSIGSGFEAYNVNYNYITSPVLADFYIGNSIVFSIGPEFSYLTKAIAKSESFSNSLLFGPPKFEVSGLIGIQFKIAQHMDTGIRYSRGFTPIYSISFTNDNGQPIDGELNEYNQYFSVFFRYTI